LHQKGECNQIGAQKFRAKEVLKAQEINIKERREGNTNKTGAIEQYHFPFSSSCNFYRVFRENHLWSQ